MTHMALPAFQGTDRYRFYNGDQYHDIRSVVYDIRFEYPDTQPSTIYSSTSDGVVEIKVEEPKSNRTHLFQPSVSKSVLEEINKRLNAKGIKKLEPPAESTTDETAPQTPANATGAQSGADLSSPESQTPSADQREEQPKQEAKSSHATSSPAKEQQKHCLCTKSSHINVLA